MYIYDYAKLMRLFSYLKQTKDVTLKYLVDVTVSLFLAYVDTSFGIHNDGTNRIDMFLIIGVAIVANCHQICYISRNFGQIEDCKNRLERSMLERNSGMFSDYFELFGSAPYSEMIIVNKDEQ